MFENLETNLIAIAILLFISALFSCFETAITAASRARAHRLANEGVKSAKILETLLQNRDKVIGAMLLGNNAINILASAIATIVLDKVFGDSGIFYVTVIMTLIILIFSEILPKTYAIRYSDSVSLLFAKPISLIVKIFFPLINLIHRLVNFFLNHFFFKAGEEFHDKHLLERNEIRETIYLKHKEGLIYSYDHKMIEGVLDLAEVEVCEIMIHRQDIVSINADLPTAEIFRIAIIAMHSKIPLWQNSSENIVAVLDVKKMLRNVRLLQANLLDNLADLSIDKYCLEPLFVPQSNSLRTQLVEFSHKSQRMAFVVDEYGSLQGLITLEDIITEIVGDVGDGSVNQDSDIIKINNGHYKIAGTAMIRNLNKRLQWNLVEDGDAYNLAGLIINHLGYVPDEKVRFTIGDYQFEILQKKYNQIRWIKAKQMSKSS